MNSLTTRHRFAWLFVSTRWIGGTGATVALAAVLAACGVGGEGTGGTSSEQLVSGRVEGFGSVVVAGERLEDSGAELLEVIDPRFPTSRPLSELRLGHQVTVASEAGHARKLSLMPAVVGRLEAFDAATQRLVVAGQPVQLNSAPSEPTVLDGIGSLTTLALGTPLVVHGQRAADGRIYASHVQRREALPGARVSGRIDAVDAAQGTIRIGTLIVDIRASQRLPARYLPVVGDAVVVFGPAAAQPAMWQASVIDARPKFEHVDGPVRLRGLLERWDPTSATGVIAGATLDFTAMPAAERAALVAGDLLLVQARVEGGRVIAELTQRLDRFQALRAQIDARVGGLVDGRRFEMRGTAVDASVARFDGLIDRNIAQGVPLRVSGEVTADGIRAESVEPGSVVPGDVVVQAGVVDSWNLGSRQMRLQGLTAAVRLAVDAIVVGGDLGLLGPGRAVSLRGSTQGVEFIANYIDLGDPQALVEYSGLAGNVEAGAAGAGDFEIGPVDMVWTATTRFVGTTGTAADLVDGRFIRVRGIRSGTVIIATEVDTRISIPGTVRLTGTVTDFIGPADFRINGQRVDAAAATFNPPELRTALAGATVEVEGVLSGGVLRATSVRDP